MSAGDQPLRRTYSSPHRRDQAAGTRAAVLAAATRLFGDAGWARTGMRDIGREAGVSVETVYACFGSKADLLMAALDVAVVGDADPVPLDRRPEFTALGVGTRESRIRAAARLATRVHRRTAGINAALREAAASEEALDQLLRQREEGRLRDVTDGMTLVLGRAPSVEQAEALWAVLDLGVHRLLTELRGWTDEHYEAWLADTIDRLLDEGPVPR